MPETPDHPIAEPAEPAAPAPAADLPATEAAAPPAIADLAPAACAARLAELFPPVFGQGVFQPLKLRIQADIQQRAPGIFTRKALSVFLHRHTTANAYLKSLVAAPHRVDLDGQPAGEVSDEHRAAAVAELERRRALHEARRAAERQAQRDAQRQALEAQRLAQEAARREQAVDDQARRERALLLRAFETTTLTPANFCALKGLSETALEATLAQAREERRQEREAPRPRPSPPQAGQRPPGHGADRHPHPPSRPAAKSGRRRPPPSAKPAQ